MRKTIGVALAATLLLALVALPAAAQEEDDYPPEAPECALSDTVVAAGDTVGVACDDWAPNTTVTGTLFSTPVVLGTTVTDAAGRLSEGFAIPANTAPGPHTLRMSGLNPQNVPTNVDLAITVVDPDDDDGVVTPPVRGITPAPGLPRTGGTTVLALVLAAGLLGAGGTALGVARRRNRGEMPEVSSA